MSTMEIGKNLLRILLATLGAAIVIAHQFIGPLGDGESMLLAGVLIGAPLGSYVEQIRSTKT